MEFGILGPLLVAAPDGTELTIAGTRRRVLLLRLLVDANRAIPAERLAEDVWNGAPPPSVQATLQSHVSLLRKALGSNRVVTDGSGYRLVADPGEIDAARFAVEVAAARATDPSDAVTRLEAALSGWRGPALVEVAGMAWAVPEATRLEVLRMSAVESLLEAQLLLAHHTEVIARAEAAVAETPLRERLWALLMTALYRAGRQADALAAYQRVRTLLRDELGIDPSPELRELVP